MPDKRLERNRAAYRCGRSFVIVPWRHCDCRGCAFARLMESRMRAGLAPSGLTWAEHYKGAEEWLADPDQL